ncbi:helix-turn-helix domain-containing protein [uncultured Tateyamaria sp.]|uniref:helix-turn-helix domain-containing protein n=1 Tax=uncultured Tateyamaria sp. TaxID=455651 RepID=UPI002626CE4E|nr:helix-turn-helix domain-containing protein [uncultured Tateyamaria sp.]
MPDFLHRRRLARMIDRTASQVSDVAVPDKGWIASVRHALGMSAEQVARRKGVSRNAVYQAERSEQDGAVSIKQMEQLAAAMGARFVYAIVPEARIEDLKYAQAMKLAHALIADEPEADTWSADARQDWIEDKAAELLHDMPPTFWDDK